jgi:hypothetical protein
VHVCLCASVCASVCLCVPLCVSVCVCACVRVRHRREIFESQMCMCPQGDAPTSGRVFEAAAAACVPIVVAPRGLMPTDMPFPSLIKWDEVSSLSGAGEGFRVYDFQIFGRTAFFNGWLVLIRCLQNLLQIAFFTDNFEQISAKPGGLDTFAKVKSLRLAPSPKLAPQTLNPQPSQGFQLGYPQSGQTLNPKP